jgi:hypothetical protein
LPFHPKPLNPLPPMPPIATSQLRIDTQRHADALAGLKVTEPIWQAIEARFGLAIADANDWTTHPDTPEDKRAGHAGRERGLRDLWQELVELQNGEYKHWPEMAAGRGTESGKTGKRESEHDD